MAIDKPDFLVYTADLADCASSDAVLKFKGEGIDGVSPNIPLYSQMPGWKHITIQAKLLTKTPASLTTGAKFTMKTSAFVDADLTTSSTTATKGDGSTALETANITAIGETALVSMSREGATSAVSNIGSVLGAVYDRTSMTACTGTLVVLITR